MASAVFGALQTAEAIGGLISLTKKVIDYCQRLARAETTAIRILNQIEGFKQILEGHAIVLNRQREPNLERVSHDERAQLVSHINTAVQSCQHTLKGMDAFFKTIFLDLGVDLLSNINARRRFISHEAKIHEFLGQLEGQKITLLIAFAILGFYDQQRSSYEDESANTRIRELSIHINYGYEYFCNWVDVPRPLTDVTVDSLSLLSADVSAEIKRTFADLLSVRDLAKNVRRRLKTSRQLSDSRKDSAGDAVLIEEVDSRSALLLEPIRTLDSTNNISPSAIDDQNHDFLHVGIATGRKIRSISNVGLLNYSLDCCLEHARKCQRDSSFDLAEQHLEKAIAYSEQREKLEDGAPFNDRTTLLEELAYVCKEVYNWTAAIRILKLLLRRGSSAEAADESSGKKDVVSLARQNQLLASVLFDKCSLRMNESDQTLDEALERATEAWSHWETVQKSRPLTSGERNHFLYCARLLEQIWECKGEPVEASFYGRQLHQSQSAKSYDAYSTSMTKPPPTDYGPVLWNHTADDNYRRGVFEAAKQAVEAADLHTIQQIFGATESYISVNDQFENGQTILHYAAANAPCAVVQQLLRLGANVNIKDVHQETALVKAVSKDRSDSVKVLLHWPRGALDLHVRLSNGQSILHYALHRGGIETARALLDADRTLINLKDCDGRTALHQCAEDGDEEKAGFLLDFHPDYIAKDVRDRTPGNKTLTRSNSKHQRVFGLLLDYHASKHPGLSSVEVIAVVVNKSTMSQHEAKTLSMFTAVYRKSKKMDKVRSTETFISDLSKEDPRGRVTEADHKTSRVSMFRRWKS